MLKFLRVALACLCFACVPLAAQAAGVTNFPRLVAADYWTQRNAQGDTVILNAEQIKNYNKKILQSSRSMADLAHYPSQAAGDSVMTKIMDYQVLDDELYLHGNKVSDNYKNILRKLTNAGAIPSSIKVRYAVTVRRSSLRSLPTGESLFYFAGDKNFDALQETALDPGEPVAVLHFSANGFFYYVQARNYHGWISKYDVAFTDRNTWLQYVQPKEFLVVTAKERVVKTGAELVHYGQGAILPVSAVKSDTYAVAAPARKKDGTLTIMQALIRKDDASVHYGYLPYTENNILRSAFKFYGMPYGWKGSHNSVDSAGLIANAYRTVGIYLPRDVESQAAVTGKNYAFAQADEQKRLEIIQKLRPGAVLFLEGHAALYLGEISRTPYVIHALGSYYSQGNPVTTMKVLVSDLSLQRASGKNFLQDLICAAEFK